MMLNRAHYFEPDGSVKPDTLSENAWLRYLVGAEQPYWNAERISRMSDKSGNAALEYTLKTLDFLDTYTSLDDTGYGLIRTVLCWSEVAKGGTMEDRARWRARGYQLEIHNEASARIYADHVHIRDPETDPAYLLIATHGLAGQYIRGECRMESSLALRKLSSEMTQDTFCEIIEILNACIIRAVSERIWEKVKDDIHAFAVALYKGRIHELSTYERLSQLLPGMMDETASLRPEIADLFEARIFPRFDLWYFESALSPFGLEGAATLTSLALEQVNDDTVHHLNFKPLADTLYYDYEGSKHVNIYKQRIIERWLQEPESYSQHVGLMCQQLGSALMIGVRFTPVCETLIAFCVEAERSGLLSYEKSITMLFDTFGFRRDSFDRLNNEEKYLASMNDVSGSTKSSILDFVKGKSVLDVGSGGGVLLDQLAERFPEMEVIGTDISANVIEVLRAKKRREGRSWTAEIHNFVQEPFARKVDNIIFSSILHEIYSYTDRGNGMFDLSSVDTALEHAVASLHPGGRIIIRDGVKTPGDSKLRIRFHTAEGLEFFRQFLFDFRGMDSLTYEQKLVSMDEAKREVVTDINFGREFLYTYTWGSESFAHEIQECFGYYELSDFCRKLEQLGMRIVSARSLLEDGYVKHLSPLVSLFDEQGQETGFPDSNLIIAAELSS
ncbi:MAG: methyltransferase domain-containing protein [Oscillospiraceae bacterium]|nr:methyltransferase domain-containing protein [Oscillospiraceae bacterium]